MRKAGAPMSGNSREHITDSILATPVVAGFVATVAGISLQDWLLIVSLIYTVLLLVQKLWQVRGAPGAAWRWVRGLFGVAP